MLQAMTLVYLVTCWCGYTFWKFSILGLSVGNYFEILMHCKLVFIIAQAIS